MEHKDAALKPPNLVQSIERVASILELVGQNSQGMGIRDLSSILKLPKGTVHRLLSSLAYMGYIRQDPDSKNYFLGLKLLELGNMVTNQLDLIRIAKPVLRRLAEDSGETVHMAILEQNEIVYIDKIESQMNVGGLKMSSRVGSRTPANSCAVGKVLLAYSSTDNINRLIQQKGLSRRTQNSITDPALFREHLTLVRKQEYAIDDEENEPGIRCVAAPIFGDKGSAVSAISVSGPAFRVTMELIRETLRKEVMGAASEISQLLGYTGAK
jgi:IclR family transcriptional regulator, KDG regulon repressor